MNVVYQLSRILTKILTGYFIFSLSSLDFSGDPKRIKLAVKRKMRRIQRRIFYDISWPQFIAYFVKIMKGKEAAFYYFRRIKIKI
jgi:hypothetical protein